MKKIAALVLSLAVLGTARAGEVSVSEGKLRFTEKLPELSPAEQARQAARPPVVPEPYIPAVKRYLEMKN